MVSERDLEGIEWPGLDARDDRDERAGASRDDGDRRAFPERVLIANGLTDGSTFALGTLPVALFNPGRVAFAGSRAREGAMPGARGSVAAHATYTFDGSTGDAKRFRFAEVGLWDPASDEPDRSAHSATRYLAFGATTIVSGVPRRPSIARTSTRALDRSTRSNTPPRWRARARPHARGSKTDVFLR